MLKCEMKLEAMQRHMAKMEAAACRLKQPQAEITAAVAVAAVTVSCKVGMTCKTFVSCSKRNPSERNNVFVVCFDGHPRGERAVQKSASPLFGHLPDHS